MPTWKRGIRRDQQSHRKKKRPASPSRRDSPSCCLQILSASLALLDLQPSITSPHCRLGFASFHGHKAPLVPQMAKNLLVMWETWIQSLGQEDPLEKEMATHSSILAWKTPRAEEPGGLQSMVTHEPIPYNKSFSVHAHPIGSISSEYPDKHNCLKQYYV